MNQHDIKEELRDYMREVNIKNVPMWNREAISAWMEAVDLNQGTFFYYDEQKTKNVLPANYLSLDGLIEPHPQFNKFRKWFNNQKAKWEK